MTGEGLRIIWEEGEGSRSKVFGGVDTTFSNVKQVLTAFGKRFDDFNASISGARVVHGQNFNCILWCSGAGELFQGLKDKGLCKELPRRVN